MISKNKIKFIQSLERKKERELSGLFIAEGDKLISELINANFYIDTLITTEKDNLLLSSLKNEIIIVTEDEMKKISLLKTPSSMLAIVRQPTHILNLSIESSDLCLVLDSIQDPGNLGTIIRLASWFGISSIFCSESCVECYNPKVIQASMGAIAHVKVFYTNLSQLLDQFTKMQKPIYGTFMEGENIHNSSLDPKGVIIMGNEGKGITEEVSQFITHKITIPSFKTNNLHVESLNVSIATAIVCSEFRRRSS